MKKSKQKNNKIIVLIITVFMVLLSTGLVWQYKKTTYYNSLGEQLLEGNPTDCGKAKFHLHTGTSIDSSDEAIQVYQGYLMDIGDNSNLKEHYNNIAPLFVTQKIIDEKGNNGEKQGYNMRLSHFIDTEGTVYEYISCE